MKFSFATALLVGLAAEGVVGSSWFGTKPVYNKWHETELERWLSDHDIPYPTPADRKDLEDKVRTNWKTAVESPYVNWDTAQLQRYLNDQGVQIKKGTEKNKDALVSQTKSSWKVAEGDATSAYGSVQNWIFDTWTDSSLKSFCDKHGIPVPQPRKRDTLLKAARENYQTAANKAKESVNYPGNWLYQSWSNSELKAWLDERGIPIPQGGARDKMIATIRRNAYLASKGTYAAASSASSSAAAAQKTLSEQLLDSWSDSDIKAWADKNGIKVPQGSTRNELLAIARKNAAKLTGDNVADSASSYYGAATSSAGNEYAKATDNASKYGDSLYNQASSIVVSIITEVQIALGLKTDYLSSASKSAASASAKATKAAKGEL